MNIGQKRITFFDYLNLENDIEKKTRQVSCRMTAYGSIELYVAVMPWIVGRLNPAPLESVAFRCRVGLLVKQDMLLSRIVGNSERLLTKGKDRLCFRLEYFGDRAWALSLRGT